MRIILKSLAVLVLMIPVSCGEPNAPQATDMGAPGGADGAGAVPDDVERALGQVASSLANHQFGIATVKVVF